MAVEHEGRSPQVDPEARVAPTAVLCGDVRVAAGARVLLRGRAEEATAHYAELFGGHRDDRVIG